MQKCVDTRAKRLFRKSKVHDALNLQEHVRHCLKGKTVAQCLMYVPNACDFTVVYFTESLHGIQKSKIFFLCCFYAEISGEPKQNTLEEICLHKNDNHDLCFKKKFIKMLPLLEEKRVQDPYFKGYFHIRFEGLLQYSDSKHTKHLKVTVQVGLRVLHHLVKLQVKLLRGEKVILSFVYKIAKIFYNILTKC